MWKRKINCSLHPIFSPEQRVWMQPRKCYLQASVKSMSDILSRCKFYINFYHNNHKQILYLLRVQLYITIAISPYFGFIFIFLKISTSVRVLNVTQSQRNSIFLGSHFKLSNVLYIPLLRRLTSMKALTFKNTEKRQTINFMIFFLQ